MIDPPRMLNGLPVHRSYPRSTTRLSRHRRQACRRRRSASHRRLLGDLGEELVVGAERLEAVDEQLEAGRGVAVGGEAGQHPAQLPDLLQLLAVEQQLLVAGASTRRRRSPGRCGARRACGRGAAPCCRCP